MTDFILPPPRKSLPPVPPLPTQWEIQQVVRRGTKDVVASFISVIFVAVLIGAHIILAW